MTDAEVLCLGVDHGHVGSWLTQRWNIPDDINKAIAQHHIRPADTPTYSLPGVIDWSDRLTHLFDGREPMQVVERLQEDQDWLAWYPAKGLPTAELVARLHQRLERSLTMVSILR